MNPERIPIREDVSRRYIGMAAGILGLRKLIDESPDASEDELLTTFNTASGSSVSNEQKSYIINAIHKYK